MYQCCIFDLDGTIINTLHSLKKTVNETIKQFGYGPIDEYHVRYFVGDGYKKLVERTLVYCGDTELTHYEEALTSTTRCSRNTAYIRWNRMQGCRIF